MPVDVARIDDENVFVDHGALRDLVHYVIPYYSVAELSHHMPTLTEEYCED